MDLLSVSVGFLVGVATGASGSYFGTLFTEKRQKKEQSKEIKSRFKELDATMPDLFNEMKEDLLRPENSLKLIFLLKRVMLIRMHLLNLFLSLFIHNALIT